MELNKVSINDRSIESAGIPKDYKEALAELIWNGFDAGATQVDIDFDANEIEHIDYVIVRDNGSGIDHKMLPQTFGTLLDSVKNVSYQRSSYIHGQKGKGRFSFTTFARHAVWSTVCNPDGQAFEYSIAIHSRSKDEYELSKVRKAKAKAKTGTEVHLSHLFGVTASSFQNNEFHEFLCQQFGWFLFLNRKNDFTLNINGEELNYSNIIAEYDVKAVILEDPFTDELCSFDLTFLRWKTRIGDRYYHYFLNQQKREVGKSLTSFNNNAIDFHHSVFIESNFFDDFGIDRQDPGSRLIGKNQSHPVFKGLIQELHSFVSEKEEEFIRDEAAGKLVREYQILGVMPEFHANAYEHARNKNLENCIRELYAIEPRLFKGLNREQQKTFVSMLALLLDSPNRIKLYDLIVEIVDLDEEQKAVLYKLFAPSETSMVSEFLLNTKVRSQIVTDLQYFSNDKEAFAESQDFIRNLLNNNLWLIDESYHNAVANRSTAEALRQSLTLLDGTKKADKEHIRPHVFSAYKQWIYDVERGGEGLELNMLIDLKAPDYKLGQKDYRAIETWLRSVTKDSLNQNLIWRFYAIGDKVEPFLREKYGSLKKKKRPFLVHALRNYEIYIMTWKDIFEHFAKKQSFDMGRQSIERAALEDLMR